MRYRDYEEDYDFYEDYDDIDYSPKKKSKWKGWLYALSGVLALTAIAGAVTAIFHEKETVEVPTLGLTQEGLEMDGEISLKLENPKGVYFTANLTKELKDEVESSEDKSFGFVVAPISYFLRVDTAANATEIDWAKAFADEKITPLYMENCEVKTKRTVEGEVVGYYIQDCLTSILYKNTNVDFVGVAFVKTETDEGAIYQYASYLNGMNYKTYAKSYAYVVSKALNDRALNGTYYSESDLEAMHTVINDSVDFANQLSTPTADGSIYEVTLSETEKTLFEGESFTLAATVTESVKVPMAWTSSNEEVVTVVNGVVTAKGTGNATVTVYVAGEAYTCTVEVAKTQDTQSAEEEE